jgi:CheY-like chemotaxis protein
MTSWMIVEDEPGIYEVLVAMSEIVGKQGVAFVDGDEAVAWIEEVDKGSFDGELPELALIDIRLPTDISGPMVGARLRKSPRLGNIGIVLITAFIMRDEVKAGYIAEADADLLLPKPLPSVAEMQKILGQVVADRARKASATPSSQQTAAAPATPVAPPVPPAAPSKPPVAPSAVKPPSSNGNGSHPPAAPSKPSGPPSPFIPPTKPTNR